jgi:8-oxo-dGTP pyrophosphatase MutT (NUDIX family)
MSDRAAAASDRDTAGTEARDFAVLDRTVHFEGPVFRLVSDDVSMPGGVRARRDYLQHVGAVGIVAIDDDDRVVLVRQYRHPVGTFLWELPAGLIDVAGEPLVQAAARELAEEADLVAADWQLLTDIHSTPGSSNEVIRLFVARGLREVPDIDRYQREHEEATMTVERVPLDEAVGMVLGGRITNAAAAVGVLAAERLRDAGWPVLRAIDEPLAPRRSGDLP